jgi:hypothetical protein
MTTPNLSAQQPATNDPAPYDASAARDALDSMSQLMVGTKMLQNEPGVTYALYQQQAHPQEAQAVDQFMQGLDAEKRVALARQDPTKTPIVLSPVEKQLLTANGVDYSGVEYTPQNAAADATKLIQTQSKGQYTAKLNPDGSLALSPTGNILTVKSGSAEHAQQVIDKLKHAGGGNFFDSIGNALSGAAGDVMTGINKAGNFAQAEASKGLHMLENIPAGIGGNANPNDRSAAVPDDTTAQDMLAQGYDPNNLFSRMAFEASGHSHTSLSDLNDQYSPEEVTKVLQILKDPQAYKTSIESDPSNYVKTPDGQTALTAPAQAELKYLQSKEYVDLAKQINAHSQTVGNDLANAVGLDPVKHSTEYNITAAVSNIAASFAIDPTLMALQGVKVAKFAQVGIDTLGDADKAASILTRDSSLPWVNNVQRGWKQAIDYGNQMRAASAANDTEKLASLTARFNAELPGLSPIMGEFIGKNAVTGWHDVVENGKKISKPIFGETDGIRSLDEAADWVKNKQGLNLLMNGRAATQASLMPGALSAVGYRSLKGMTADWMTSRSYERVNQAYDTVVSAAEADPALAKKLIDNKTIVRFQPNADDAVDATTDQVLADHFALTAQGKGDVNYNLRRYGDPLGTDGGAGSVTGLFSPTAVAARSRLAASRFTTLLPRNTLINIDDPASGDKIAKYAAQYLGRGDSQAIRAAWTVGNPGQRRAIVTGLFDQVAHSAGLTMSKTGRDLIDKFKTSEENYANAGDNIEINGQRMAMLDGETTAAWRLPAFRDIHHAAAKTGLWEATMGRALTGQPADLLMNQWKVGALFRYATVTRNQLEAGLRTILDGKAGDALKARVWLTTPMKELWDRGYGLEARDQYVKERGNVEGLQSMLSGGGLSQEQRANAFDQINESKRVMDTLEHQPIVQHLHATEAGDTALANRIAKSTSLAGDLERGTVGFTAAHALPLAAIGRAYRSLWGHFMDEETVKAFMTRTPQDIVDMAHGYGQQILEGDLGMRNAATQANDVSAHGWNANQIRFNFQDARARNLNPATEADRLASDAREGIVSGGTRWTHQATDGTVGADRFANALHRKIDATPETARAVIAHLTAPREEQDIQTVVSALEKESKRTAFGKVYFDDPAGNPTKGRWALNDAEAAQGKVDWAHVVVNEFSSLLHGQNGEFQHELADYITEHGTAPDADWISGHMLNDNRPAAVVAPEVMARADATDPAGFWQRLQDMEGAAFDYFVARPLHRTMTMPVTMANYAKARVGMNQQVEEMVAKGFSREAAENMAADISVRNAWIKTEQLVDDPGQKTQFDVVARNMFPFARAVNAMARRWGTGLWQNPAAARKMMLAYEGAVHSGFIYNNVYGEPTFTYPGSGVMNMVMREVAKIPGFENVAAFPIASDMTGGVKMAVPGADNPFRMSMGPMISIPFREFYKHVLPTSYQGDLTKIDTAINGPVGTGETWTQLVPTVARQVLKNMSTDQRNSVMASSMSGAFANLAAAGLVPSTQNASSEVMNQFRNRLQSQVRSQLFLRAVFGFFSPAAPSAPSEGTSASGADFAWSMSGIQQLSDEYKQILNETGGDVGRANAVFTTLHPDEVVYKVDGAPSDETKMPASAYETGRSGSTVKGAYLASTDSALQWMTTHADFVKQYPSVSAYFLPNSTTNEPFSDAAYQAQLELGLRQRKSPQEFMDAVYLKHAESMYYPTVKAYDAKIAEVKLTGDKATASYWTASKSNWEQTYQSINPLLKAKMQDYGNARAKAGNQLIDLQHMYDNNAVPDGQRVLLGQLLQSYKDYENLIQQYKGSDTYNRTVRSNAIQILDQWAADHLTGTPLQDVYNGVFNTLNTNLTKIGGGN